MTQQERKDRLAELTHEAWVIERIRAEDRSDEQRKHLSSLAVERWQHEAVLNWPRTAVRLGLPKRLWRVARASEDYGEAQSTEAYRAVEEYLGRGDDTDEPSGLERGESLILAGPTGTGKSYAAAYAAVVAEELLEQPSRFLYWPALCGRLLVQEHRPDALALVKTIHCAVLDDFGTEYAKDGGLVEALTDEIIWHREGNSLPTILTTNLTPEQLRQRWSDRIVDRLSGWGKTISCTGPSLRSTNQQEAPG